MSTEIQTTNQQVTVKTFFGQDNVKKRIEEMLGKRSNQFITSVLQIVASNMPADVEPKSVYNAAMVAATLDLPLNNNLGFAYILSYNSRQKDGTYKAVAQFQMGYKGFIQLAQRSGQIKNIYASEIYEGEILESNPLTGYKFDFSKRGTAEQSQNVIGYAARMELINSFESVFYMSKQQLNGHATRFSQTFKKGFGLWKDDFDSMAKKTVIKLLISKYAPLSIEMQQAVQLDQSIVNNEDGTEFTYIDNEKEVIDLDLVNAQKQYERVSLHIANSKTIDELETVFEHLEDDMHKSLYDAKKSELTPKKAK